MKIYTLKVKVRTPYVRYESCIIRGSESIEHADGVQRFQSCSNVCREETYDGKEIRIQ